MKELTNFNQFNLSEITLKFDINYMKAFILIIASNKNKIKILWWKEKGSKNLFSQRG